MKQIKSSFNTVLFAIMLAFTLNVNAAEYSVQDTDNIKISLLTCGPGNEVWSLYGHTAIRYQDNNTGYDVAINYGMFSFDQDYFIMRFVFGLTDYKMGICPMDDFMAEYGHEGRWVVQQDLNLTREDKTAIRKALEKNSLPQNVTYRYNFFYDNCTTRARDMIAKNITGTVVYDSDSVSTTYRKMTHQWNEYHRWSRFGNDLLLGVKADRKANMTDRQFLPDSLRNDFDNAYVIKSGTKRKLVTNKFYLIPPSKYMQKTQIVTVVIADFITPDIVFGIMFILILFASGLQIKKKYRLWILDAILLLTSGCAGLILLAMVFSQHPTVNLNLQILVLNPLSLVFLYPAIRNLRKGIGHCYWQILTGCIIAFLVGGLIQDYAEGMYFVALSLLIRSIINIKLSKK